MDEMDPEPKVDCSHDDDDTDHSSNNDDDDSTMLPMCFMEGPPAVSRDHSSTTMITTEPVPVVEHAIVECLEWAVQSHDHTVLTDVTAWWSPTAETPSADPHFVLADWKPQILVLPAAALGEKSDTVWSNGGSPPPSQQAEPD